MEIDRLKKLAGLNESDTLSAEIKKAEVERKAEKQEKPSFKGLLSGEHNEDSAGFSFLKSLKKKEPIEEANPYDDNPKYDRAVEAAHDYYDEAFGFEYVKTEEGQKEIFNELLQYMRDVVVDPKRESEGVQDWVDLFNSAWETYCDKVLGEAGLEYYYDEDGMGEETVDYSDLKLEPAYKKLFADEFAKWAVKNQDAINQDGFSDFPEVGSGEFASRVTSNINESVETESEIQEDIEEINEDLYNKIIDTRANCGLEDNGLAVGFVMENLSIARTRKNIALVESVILKK